MNDMQTNFILNEISEILDSAFFCPLTPTLSERVTKAEEVAKNFHLDSELMEEYSKTALELLSHRKEKSKDKKVIKNLKNKMQFLHILIFKKFKREHPEEVNDYKKYQECLYRELPPLEDFIFEPEWVKAASDFFGMSNFLEELERVVGETEGKLSELTEKEQEEIDNLGNKIGREILKENGMAQKNDRVFRRYIREKILPTQPEKFRPFLYINLYKSFCVITMESWVYSTRP